MRQLIIVALIGTSGCSSVDKCQHVVDKVAAAYERELGTKHSARDLDRQAEKCRARLKTNPEQEKALDCIIALGGTPTIAATEKCQEAFKGQTIEAPGSATTPPH